MTKLGMPGVFTHGNFDTWSPGYLMFMAAMHNGVSRLYETFGNGGADTETRELDSDETSRTWYRQDPPYPYVSWSQRNNNNYEQTGLLVSLAFTAENHELLLRNFWAKGKRSVEKPRREGPAAYVLPGDDKRPGAQAELVRVLQLQHVEISRATSAFTVDVPAASGKSAKKDDDAKKTGDQGAEDKGAGAKKPVSRTFPRRHLRGAHGPALQPHRRRAARPPVLEPRRSAETALRRHRVELRRHVRRRDGARHRHQGAVRGRGAREVPAAACRQGHR
jgi:hypothetical protein